MFSFTKDSARDDFRRYVALPGFTLAILWLLTPFTVAAQEEIKEKRPSLEIRNPKATRGSTTGEAAGGIRVADRLKIPARNPIGILHANVTPCTDAEPLCLSLGPGWHLWKVKVHLQVTGEPEEYQVSERPDYADATWQPYKERFAYVLSGGLGEKTLHIRVRGKKAAPVIAIAPAAASTPTPGRREPAQFSAAGRDTNGDLAAPGIDREGLREQAMNVQYAALSTQYRVNGTIRIASIGESYAAGEGAPDSGTGDARTTQWESQQCHRSERNGRTLAVEALKESFGDDVQILYRDFSCSGASINVGLLGPFAGMRALDGEIQDAVPAQIAEARAWLGGHRLDILLLSVGGNDVGFAEAIAECISPGARKLASLPPEFEAPWACGENAELRSLVENGDPNNATAKIGFANLPAAYARLDKAIDSDLRARRVLATEYPDPTRDENGRVCGCAFSAGTSPDVLLPEGGDGTWAEGCFNEDFAVRPENMADYGGAMTPVRTLAGFAVGASSTHLWQQETLWIRENILGELNDQIQRAAARHGWTYVGGIALATRFHGLCAADGERWFNTLRDSWEHQGDIFGAVHPNEAGHVAYKEAILESLGSVLRK